MAADFVGAISITDRNHHPDLVSLFARPEWHERAACRGLGPGEWFPARGGVHESAAAVCSGCPVRDECLAFGLRQPAGIWGGLNERQRRQLRRGSGKARRSVGRGAA